MWPVTRPFTAVSLKLCHGLRSGKFGRALVNRYDSITKRYVSGLGLDVVLSMWLPLPPLSEPSPKEPEAEDGEKSEKRN